VAVAVVAAVAVAGAVVVSDERDERDRYQNRREAEGDTLLFRPGSGVDAATERERERSGRVTVTPPTGGSGSSFLPLHSLLSSFFSSSRCCFMFNCLWWRRRRASRSFDFGFPALRCKENLFISRPTCAVLVGNSTRVARRTFKES